jgi:hypothetical protein
MIHQKQVLLLIGSPRQPAGTSWSLGSYLLERLHEKHCKPRLLYIHQALASEQAGSEMITTASAAELLLWSFPLYADSVPACVIKTMELLAAYRTGSTADKLQQMAVLVNCGFPDVYHIDPAIAVCRCFAHKTGFDWLGGLSVCEGDVIIGRPLLSLGRSVRHITAALDLSADALAAGKPLPPEAVSMIAKPIIPPRFFPLYARAGILRRACNEKALFRLTERPFEED